MEHKIAEFKTTTELLTSPLHTQSIVQQLFV